MKALELRDWCITIKDWMRNNENIDDLPFYVLVLACEIPNFTKSLFKVLSMGEYNLCLISNFCDFNLSRIM